MREGQGSRTAERVAFRRAVHQLVDDPPVFHDPIAWAVVHPRLAAELRTGRRALERSRSGRYLRAFLVARSRVAEDELAAEVARGVRQYVIVGAGFDTFAYRNPHAVAGLRVFEVDHPSTQRVKRARLATANVPPPDSLTFVAADLAALPLGEALQQSGFDPGAPSFFSWLGVLPYLELPAIRATLRFVATLPAATIVFDYGVRPGAFHLLTRFVLWRMGRRVASIGEPWRTLFQPEELARELDTAGFKHVEDLGPAEINRRYFDDRKDRLRVRGIGHIVIAASEEIRPD
jgi:methyltransferase (TIGR00027 family)